MRRRIKSVKNTQQITKAMKMVAAAKLKRAQDRVTASRPFAGKMSEVLGALSSNVGDFSHPLLDERGDSKYLIVLISADKGLAGAFNANVIKATQAFVRENEGKVDEMIAAVRTANVPVLWVGVPAVRGAKSTADLNYLNDIIRPRVEKAGRGRWALGAAPCAGGKGVRATMHPALVSTQVRCQARRMRLRFGAGASG